MSDTIRQSVEWEPTSLPDLGASNPDHPALSPVRAVRDDSTTPFGQGGAFSGDGAANLLRNHLRVQQVSAIFIHAGAGYHSIANENIHLQACSE